MGISKYILEKDPGLSSWCILLCYRGSIAHGMYIPNSNPDSIDDKDIMSICVPPVDYYFGLKQYGSRGTKEIKQDEWDIVIYEAKKAINMLINGNPNILMILWLKKKHYINITSAGQYLIDNRELFIGKHVYKSFTGYAYGQLKRIEHCAFNGYMGKKRKQLVEKFGYDTHNAAHLIRLLRMSIEFLTDGVLYVERHDSQQLLQIKRGEWSLEQVKKEADRLFISAEQAYIQSKLPIEPDKDKINNLCILIIREAITDQIKKKSKWL